MKKLVSVLLLGAMMLSMLASCGFELPQMPELDLDAYPQDAIAQGVAWDGSASDTTWYTNDPSAKTFSISTGAELKGFIDLVYAAEGTIDFEDQTIQLNDSIDLGGQTWSIPATDGCFKGTFDGNSKTISNFNMTVTASNQSLLGAIGGNATVQNLTVTGGTLNINMAVKNQTGVASVISRVICEADKTVTIENVDANCTIKQKADTPSVTRVGGIIGVIEEKTDEVGTAVNISNCEFSGSVSCYQNHIGGIVGGATGSTPITFTDCTNSAHIIGRDQLGGILGSATYMNADLTFDNCDNSGTIEIYCEYAGGNVGGIVGRVLGGLNEAVTRDLGTSITFIDCDNTGTVGFIGSKNFKYQTEIGSANWTGGIAGYVYGGTNSSTYRYFESVSFTNCTSTGNVRAGRTSGGLVAYVQRTKQLTLTNCSVDADNQFIINDHAFKENDPTNMQNRLSGGLLGAVETKAATYTPDGGEEQAAVILDSCSVNGTLYVFEPYHFNSKVGGLVGLVRRAMIQLTNCAVNVKFSTEHLERDADAVDLDEVNQVIGGFQNSGNYYNGKEKQSVTYFYHNEIPVVEDYATANNTAAYFKPLGYQERYNAETNTYDFRYVFGVNNLQANDQGIGFRVAAKLLGDQVENKNITVYCPTIYTSVQAGSELFTAADANCEYICTLVIAGIPANEVVTIDGKPYSKNTILDITPITAYKDANEEVIVTEASIGSARHAYEHERYTFKQEAFTPYLPTVFAEKAASVTEPTQEKDIGEDIYEIYASFTFEVDEAGYYDFCFHINLDGDADEQTRYALMQFDDESYQTQTELYTTVAVRDGIMRDDDTNCNSYIVGYGRELSAGSHTVTFRQPYDSLDGTDKSSYLDVRGIYFYKDAADPVDADIPLPDGAVLYDGNSVNTVTYALDGTTETVFDTYRGALEAADFVLQDERTTNFQYSPFDATNTPADGNYTYTGNYKDDTTYYNKYYIYTNADYMVNVYFCTATGDMRVVVSDVEQYDSYKAVNDAAKQEYQTVTTPLFAQLDIGGRNFTATSGSYISGVTNGLCYVYRLSDGRFIVIDGGFWNDKDTNGDEMARLFSWLQLHADYDGDGYYFNNKVTIAAWLITHQHSDHINGAYKFGMMYKDNELVEIQNFLYNFPSYEYASSNYGTDLQIGGEYTKYYPKMYTMLGHYNSLIVHSGMVFNFADASIEILATHEDFYPDLLNIYNNSSTIFKITLDGKTFLIAGDLQEEGQIKHIKRTGTLLESDFLQVTHHGCNGQLEFFKYIVGLDQNGEFNTDTVILWPLPKGEDQRWYEGTSARAVAMRWLRDSFNTAENDTTHFAIENWDTDTTVIPNFTDSDFSSTMPAALNGSNVITVAGSNCELGCTSTEGNLYTNAPPALGMGSANGVVKLQRSNLYHYYIDISLSTYATAGVNKLNEYNSYIQFSFAVSAEQAGTYEIYSYMRAKQDSRRGIIFIDNKDPMKMSYTITNLASIVDDKEGSYMHWDGVSVELTEGTHTLTYMLEPEAGNVSWHFRTLYFVRVGN